MKRRIVYVFLIVIYLPIVLGIIGKISRVEFDVELLGYTDSVEKPLLSTETYIDGSFQDRYNMWFEGNMPLRGVFTKTYNSIRYEMFELGNRPIGDNESIYEENYIYAELAIDEYNYATLENDDRMKDMVAHMESVNEKLDALGKNFYVYIAPSKADINSEEIPSKYAALSEPESVNMVDLFREYISETEVPYLICSDMADDLEYPAFYPTGIHWSRTYEQAVSQRIIADLGDLSGENYRNIYFTGVESGKSSYWRDTDVYDLLNVWGYPNTEYYQYTVEVTEDEDTVPLNLLLVGDSFAQGLIKDIGENFPEDSITYFNRDDYVVEPNGTVYSMTESSWEEYDWQRYLDQNDFVIIEIVEPEMLYHTYGFIEFLDEYLDGYVPMESEGECVSELDGSNADNWDSSFAVGIYELEDGYAWIKPTCRVTLCNSEITDKGLEIELYIPEQLFEAEDSVSVEIRINSSLVLTRTYISSTQDKIIIPTEKIVSVENDEYIVTIQTSQFFNPSIRGESQDNRDLALQLFYIGGVR